MSTPRAVRRVLVVDDDESVAFAITAALESAATEVGVVHQGALVLDALNAYQPDLIILDIGLPDIDGLTLSHLIRKQSGVPIALISGHLADLRDRPPRTVFLQKPFSVRELNEALRELDSIFIAF